MPNAMRIRRAGCSGRRSDTTAASSVSTTATSAGRSRNAIEANGIIAGHGDGEHPSDGSASPSACRLIADDHHARRGQHQDRHEHVSGETDLARDGDAFAEHYERNPGQPRVERRPVHLAIRIVRERDEVAVADSTPDRYSEQRMRALIPANREILGDDARVDQRAEPRRRRRPRLP